MLGVSREAQSYMRSSVPDRNLESHGSSQEYKANLSFGFSMNSHNVQGVGTQRIFESPSVYDGHGKSSSVHLTSSVRSAPQNASKQEEEEEQCWIKNFEQRILERERMVGDVPVKKENRKSLKVISQFIPFCSFVDFI